MVKFFEREEENNKMIIKKLIVRLRMWYADIRGHHGKRWDYEPGDWYMGRHKTRTSGPGKVINKSGWPR